MSGPEISATSPTNKVSPPPPSKIDGAPLNVHLAEYTALTTRMTYWISLQYLTYSVGAVVLSLLVQAWATAKLNPMTLAWIGFFLVLLLIWAWIYIVWEILNTAVYLEGELRVKVEGLIGEKAFWGWEPYLAGQRNKGYNKYEWTFALLVLLVLGVGTFGWTMSAVMKNFAAWRSYWGWAAVSTYALIMIGARVREVLRLQVKLRDIGNSNLKRAKTHGG
jgi:hypothetical protein